MDISSLVVILPTLGAHNQLCVAGAHGLLSTLILHTLMGTSSYPTCMCMAHNYALLTVW